MVPCHLAESRQEAMENVRLGSGREVTEYFAGTLGNPAPDVPMDKIVDFMVEHNQWIVGTPEDCIAGIERLQEASGGFGGFMIRVDDYVQREKRLRSYELFARYVMPHFQGSLSGIMASNQWARSVKRRCMGMPLPGSSRPPMPISRGAIDLMVGAIRRREPGESGVCDTETVICWPPLTPSAIAPTLAPLIPTSRAVDAQQTAMST